MSAHEDLMEQLIEERKERLRLQAELENLRTQYVVLGDDYRAVVEENRGRQAMEDILALLEGKE